MHGINQYGSKRGSKTPDYPGVVLSSMSSKSTRINLTRTRWILVGIAGLVLVLASLLFRGDLPAAEVDAKYSNDASRFLPMENGARVHYRDEGKAEGAAVVLIHGAMASLHTWEPWVAILGQRYRVISLDLPAHGLTGQVPEGAYGADAFTETIDAVVNELGVERFVLGGNSMGGGATWRYALTHPQRVRAMILVDSVAPGDWRESATAAATKDDAESERSAPVGFALLRQSWFRAIARYLDPAPLVEQGLLSAYNNSPVVNQALIDRYYELILREGTRAAILNRSNSYSRNGTSNDVSTLSQPTLVMWGAQDSLIPVSVADQFAQRLPNTQVVIYDDLGHIPMEEDPQRSAADVLNFLDQLPVINN